MLRSFSLSGKIFPESISVLTLALVFIFDLGVVFNIETSSSEFDGVLIGSAFLSLPTKKTVGYPSIFASCLNVGITVSK